MRHILSDGWQNPDAGLGTTRDKGRLWQFYRERWGVGWQLDGYAHAYAEDDVVHTVATVLPDEMLARGYEIHVKNKRDEETEAHIKTLGVIEALRNALVWERLLGGGAMLLGAEDGRDKTEPLDPRVVRSLSFVKDFDRRELDRETGRPGVARLRTADGRVHDVHESRLVWFTGRPLPARERRERLGWGVGDVELAWDEIAAFQGAWTALRHLLVDANQAVFKISGLLKMIAAGRGAQLAERMRLVDELRSVARALLVDRDNEDFERHAVSLTGYADACDKAFERLAMAIQVPVSVLVGMQPSGLNASDAGTIRLWYDRVAKRRGPLTDAIVRVAKLSRVARGQDPAGVTVHWPSLWQPTDQENAEAEQADAGAEAARLDNLQRKIDMGLITREEAVSAWRTERGLPVPTPAVPDRPALAPVLNAVDGALDAPEIPEDAIAVLLPLPDFARRALGVVDAHVTLLYSRGELDPHEVASQLAAAWPAGGLALQLGGGAYFPDRGDGFPSVYLVEAPALHDLHGALFAALPHERSHGFVPHVMVGYLVEPAAPPPATLSWTQGTWVVTKGGRDVLRGP